MSEKKQSKEKPLNLYQKLVEIRKCVDYVQKDSKGYNYKYAKESSILMAIRPKMDELGVFLEVDMISLEQTMDNKCLVAKFEFTWVNAEDPEEKISKTIILQDLGLDVKKVGGLMTYASRYFLLKTFQIPTDEDDPDKMRKVTPEQLKTLDLTLNGYDDLREQIQSRFNGNMSDMTEEQYRLALSWVKKTIKEEKQ